MRIGISHANGDRIEGFEIENSQIPVQTDQIYSIAQWKNKNSLSELVGKQVRLHFEIQGASLYGYKFLPRV